MKKYYLIFGAVVMMRVGTSAQMAADTPVEKVSRTDIELVYNHYMQHGNHSAVTGGIGTEQLTVYGPSVKISNDRNKSILGLHAGADIVSSASTDNIDFIKSSASRNDARIYINGTYERKLSRGWNIAGGAGLSVESDYFSVNAKLGVSKEDKEKGRTWVAMFQYYNDDLRWGRTHIKYYRPVTLIYPEELRYREWYDVYKRYSYNLKLGYTQIINQRNVLGIFPEFTLQQGLLATPFHRIYFADGKAAVEQLPKDRFKASLSLRLNTFAGGRLVFKNAVNPYIDNFGILSLAVENETAVKLSPEWVLMPNARFYIQRGSMYFKPYRGHTSGETYYTSDYDLSSFRSYSAGLGVTHNMDQQLWKGPAFKSVTFRYNYYYRTAKLQAHIFSIAFDLKTAGR